jgi:hypothetical protein
MTTPEQNKQTSHYCEYHFGHEILIWKEHVDPEKPVSKTGRRIKGGVWRHMWVGYVGNDCIAAELGWHGGTRREVLAKCREWAFKLSYRRTKTEQVIELLKSRGIKTPFEDDDWFPIEHFIADQEDQSLSTAELADRYIVARKQMAEAIGAEDEEESL